MKIDLLKNHLESIPQLADIWYDVLGKIWAPSASIGDVRQRFAEHMNDELPLTVVAFEGNQPITVMNISTET